MLSLFFSVNQMLLSEGIDTVPLIEDIIESVHDPLLFLLFPSPSCCLSVRQSVKLQLSLSIIGARHSASLT